jgi:hypothetical protein
MQEQIYERGSLPEFARERYMREAATAVAPSRKTLVVRPHRSRLPGC